MNEELNPAWNKLLGESVPAIGPASRGGSKTAEQVRIQLKELLVADQSTEQRSLLINAAVLVWHDHLDAAHIIAQEIHNSDGSYLHAIIHRREPDFSNAKYWFNRVGDHPIYPQLATFTVAEVGPLFVKSGKWDSFSFVDACEKVTRNPGREPGNLVLEKIQAQEIRWLLAHFLGKNSA